MPEELELERLVEDVRATAPRPSAGFLARLDARVDAGFAAPGPARRGDRRRLASLWRPGLALAVCVLVAGIVVAGAVRSGSGGGAPDGGASVASGPAPAKAGDAVESPSAGAGGAGIAAPTPPATAPGRAQLVERTASLALETPGDEFSGVTDGVLRVADQTGAIVQRSDVTEQDGRGHADYDLRVPASRLDEALAGLSRLAHVRSRTASGDDITALYVSARARLDDARAERRALLRALGRATTDRQAEALRARIRDTRRLITALEAEVRATRARADRAGVSVTVDSTGRNGAWTPADALRDAGHILQTAASVALVAAAFALPFVVLLALALLAARTTRRRRRDAALG